LGFFSGFYQTKVGKLFRVNSFFIHLPHYPTRIPHSQGIGGDILGYNGTGTDHGIFTDGITTNDGGICTDAGGFFYKCFAVKFVSSLRKF